MVAYGTPATQTKLRPAGTLADLSGPVVAVSGFAPVPDWHSHGEGMMLNQSSKQADGVHLSSGISTPKPEPLQYREPEGEGAEYDFYLHGRKRFKLHDSLPSTMLQGHGRPPVVSYSPAPLDRVSGDGSTLPARYPQPSLPRKSNEMLPPTPVSVSAAPCNPLEDSPLGLTLKKTPSLLDLPLGLTLKKTPSLLDLITLQLQHSAGVPAAESESSGQGFGKSRIGKCLAPTGSASQDKLKASNFPASTLKIGTWERVSRYEGDLVAKCYYAKRKLVWEVLDSGLKSKIEIQWSDISAMKASCPDNLPGSLEIEVSRPPLFFKETNPQPRKHTLWQATTDFTGGQASICKCHYLQFPEGVLNRHYEKLVQCDPRLKALVDGTLPGSSPHYNSGDSAFESQSVQRHSKLRNSLGRVFDGFNDQPHSPMSSYSPLQGRMSSSVIVPELEPEIRSMEMHSNETSSPSSVMEIRRCEEGGDSDSGEYYMREDLATSSPYTVDSVYSSTMSYDMHEMKPSMNVYSGGDGVTASNRKILDEIAQMLLGDSSATLSNEQAILLAARMGSMQAAIARDLQACPPSQPTFDSFPAMEGNHGYYGVNVGRSMGADSGQVENDFDINSRLLKCNTMLDPSFNSVMQCLSKNSSTGDLLMNLPRVASLPQLFESVSSQVPLSRYNMGIQ